jgi:hypothetical protein
MDVLLKRVIAIAVATGNKDASHQIQAEGEKADEFTLAKRRLNLEIREIRNAIKERDLYTNGPGGRDKPEVVRQSTAIRIRLVDLRKQAAMMRDMVTRADEKQRSKGKSSEQIELRYKMCDLADAHIDECETWFKGHSLVDARDDPRRRALLRGAQLTDATPVNIEFARPKDSTETQLEDIDGIDEWRMQIRETEQIIDSRLDRIVEGTRMVKVLANTISREYADLGIMIDDVDHQMTKTEENLVTTNKQLKKTAKKLDAKSNCCIDIVLFLLMIAMIGYLVWKYVLK